jgi:hypothetical protein
MDHAPALDPHPVIFFIGFHANKNNNFFPNFFLLITYCWLILRQSSKVTSYHIEKSQNCKNQSFSKKLRTRIQEAKNLGYGSRIPIGNTAVIFSLVQEFFPSGHFSLLVAKLK